MKKAFALICATGILLVGCKSSGDPSTRSSTADGSTPAATEPASIEPGVGVTDDSIKIGVTYTDLAPLKDVGLNLDHGDYASAFQALADDINADGGINGRTLELVQAPVNPIGTGAGTTACTMLVEDEEVFAVLGDLQQDIVPCYVTDHDTAVVGGYQSPTALAAANAPWFTWNASVDRLATKTIEGADAAGIYEGKKVGVVSLPVDGDLVTDVVDPALEEAGAEVVDHAVIDAPANDAAAATASAQTIAEKYRSEGVEVIITVGNAFNPFANGLVQTDYRPTLVATDDNTVSAWKIGKPDESLQILDGLVAGGGVSRDDAWNEPSMQACVDTVKEAQPDRQITDPATAKEGDPETFVSLFVACRSMSLFKAIADKAGPTLNNDTFRNAGATLGEFQIPGVGGVSDFTPTAPSGDPDVYLRRWDPAIKDLVTDLEPIS
jgi:ABC-type branched-subunit amino acid transport system substrate-binding protein